MWRSAGLAGALGIEIALCFAIGGGGGYLLDRKLNTHWIMYLGLFFGLGAAIKGIMRVVNGVQARAREGRHEDRRTKRRRRCWRRIERTNLILAVLLTAPGGRALGRARRDRRGRRARRSPAPTSGCWCASAPAWSRAPATATRRAACRSCCSARRWRCSRWCSSRSRVLHLDAIPFALGFSVFVVSIMMLGSARDDDAKARGLMNPHATWFDFIPGYAALQRRPARPAGAHLDLAGVPDHATSSSSTSCARWSCSPSWRSARSATRRRSAARATRGWCRRPSSGLRNLFEVLADTVLGLMAGVMGEKAAKRYLPLVGTLFIFILFSNLLGADPRLPAARPTR